MPGLFGSFGSRDGDKLAAMEKVLQPNQIESQLEPAARPYAAIRHKTSFTTLGLLHHGALDEPISHDANRGVLIDGWLWPRAGASRLDPKEATAAEICLDLYGEFGLDFLDHVEGEFALALWDEKKKRAILANDRFGLRPLHVYRTLHSFFFAPEAKAFFAAGVAEPKLDRGTLHRYLSYGRIFMDAGTFFQGIEVLEPATVLVFDARARSFETHRRSVLSYRPRALTAAGETEMAQEVAASLRQAVGRRIRPGLRYGLHLSGGLDSRVVAGLLADELKGDGELENRAPLACTFGMEGSGEVALAEQIAHRLGLPLKSLELSPADFLDHAEVGVWRTEGLDLLTQSYAYAVFPRFAPHIDVMGTGLALDLPLGGSFMKKELLEDGATAAGALDYVESKIRTMAPDLVASLLGDGEIPRQNAAELGDLWRAHIDESSEEPADLVDGFMLRWRVWRVIIQRQVWLRLFYEETTPTFDDALFDLMLEIPAEARLGHRFYKKVMEELTPRLMDIPYQRTLLPPSAPTEFWARAAQLEGDREKLYFQIWKESQGRVHIPYRRYFSNYDEWLRLDPSWASYFDGLFGSDDIALASFGFNIDVIRELLREHRSGQANRRQALLQLATLEVFLRQFQPA